MTKPKPTPASLVDDFAEIIQNVVNWPLVDWRRYKIPIAQMATIASRIEKRLEEACSECSQSENEAWTKDASPRFDL